MDPLTGLLLGFAALAALAAGAGGGLAWGLLRRDREPRETLAAALARIELERSKDRLEQVKFIEEALDVGETIKRHRSRIDGAEGARAKREQKAAEAAAAQPELLAPIDQLEAVRQRARALGKL